MPTLRNEPDARLLKSPPVLVQPPRLATTVRQKRLRLDQVAGPSALANAFAADNLVNVPDTFAQE
jgi:hypothetical protein